MRVITVNIPKSFLERLDAICGEDKIYCSRSEAIRVALREFLIKELDSVQSFKNIDGTIPLPPLPAIDENMFVRVPIASTPEIQPTEYKTYRIIKK